MKIGNYPNYQNVIPLNIDTLYCKKHVFHKRIIVLFLSIVCSILPLMAYDFEVNGLYYIKNKTNVDEVTLVDRQYPRNQSLWGPPISPSNYKGEIIIPDSVEYENQKYAVTAIQSGTFSRSEEIVRVSMPNTIKNIGEWTFYRCYNLSEVELSSSIEEIPFFCFSESNIDSIIIPDGVKTISACAFQDCYQLENVVIPSSVEYIGRNAFEWTSWLQKQPNGLLYINNILYSYIGNMPENTIINVKEGTTLIVSNAFARCENLKELHIPASVTEIQFDMLYDSPHVSVITVSKDNPIYDSRDNCNAIIESKSNKLLYGCASTVIPNSVTSIGENAFYGAHDLVSITIPSSITEIETGAFANCESLTSITIPSSLTELHNGIFCGCCSLKEINLPNSLKSVGDSWLIVDGAYSINFPWMLWSGTFENCFALERIIIPENVTTLYGSLFEGCYNINEITIPSTMESISEAAFVYVSPQNVYCYADEPPLLCDSIQHRPKNKLPVFEYLSEDATLYVPIESLEKYKNNVSWNNFPNIVAIPERCAIPTIYYTDGKLSYKSETEGVTFHYTISDTDIKSDIGDEVQLTVTYHISVYASKEGYEDSYVAEATLCWIEVDPQKEGISEETATEAKQLQAMPVLIQAEDGQFCVEGAPEGTKVVVYDAGGVELGAAVSRGGKTLVPARVPQGSIAIVKIGEKAVKISMKH